MNCQEQIEKHESDWSNSPRWTAKERNCSRKADFLDRMIPLQGASHADVVEYSVDVPLRYAQCFAHLADGRKVRLQVASQFLGWSGHQGKRSFLFQKGWRRIEVQAAARRQVGSGHSGSNCTVVSWMFLKIDAIERPVRDPLARRFIARDGSQLVIRRWAQLFPRNIGRIGPMCGSEFLDPTGFASAATS